MVLGLGANGSSALYHLSRAGYNVCGIDRFVPPHTHGSSHGQSRIIRQAYHESPMYVPLVKEAYTLWHELEQVSGKKLFLKTGGVVLGAADATIVKGARLSAEIYRVPYEYLNNEAIQQRFPALKPTRDTVAVVEANAGILFPEDCIATHLQQAVKNGAALLYNEQVTAIRPGNNRVEIITNKATYHTRKLIVSAGAWLGDLMPDLHLPLTIKRQVLYWFLNTSAQQQPYIMPGHLPVYLWEYKPGRIFYGFPDMGKGIKIALHHEGQTIHPDQLSQQVSDEERKGMKQLMNTYLNIAARFNSSAVCMYTNTPDEHFIIDYHPIYPHIIIASPCSGHGFKFSSLTGKILADMALEKKVPFDLTPFRISRFNGGQVMRLGI